MKPSQPIIMMVIMTTVMSSIRANEMHFCTAKEQRLILPKAMHCEPRKSIITLPAPNASVLHMLPVQIEVMRCGGACDNTFHSCVSSSTRALSVQVLQTHHDGLTDCAEVEVEEHLSCGCGCQVNSDSKCDSDHHIFRANFCKCVCRDVDARQLCLTRGWHWDDQSCQCMCLRPQKWPECGSSHAFDAFGSCKCVDLQQKASTIIQVLLLVLVAAVSLALAGILSCYRTNTAFFRDNSGPHEQRHSRIRRLLMQQGSEGQRHDSSTELRTLFRALSCSADEKDDDDDRTNNRHNKPNKESQDNRLTVPTVPHRIRACTK